MPMPIAAASTTASAVPPGSRTRTNASPPPDVFARSSREPWLQQLSALRSMAASPPTPRGALEQVNTALDAIQQALGSNQTTTAHTAEARSLLEGYESHVQAIEFDRGSRDVSGHARALRAQADDSRSHGAQASESHTGASQAVERSQAAVEQAMEEVPEGNYLARSRLLSAFNDLNFAKENGVDVQAAALRKADRALGERLNPYLTEVEADEPGRDVGRFADDIEELWLQGDSNYRTAEVYGRSLVRTLSSAQAYLEAARDALT